MSITLSSFSITHELACSVEELWDLLMRPDVHKDWIEGMDGFESGEFDADIREGGHLTYGFRIGGGGPIQTKVRYLRLDKPAMSAAVEVCYEGRLAISALIRVAILPQRTAGCRIVHTETAHFLNGDATPEQHRDFVKWWYASVLRGVAVG
ncbi:SRPBCC domain-containing protein [Histidinibacterium lentulum]|uniref:SRPBCC family protein n=1 Tax=Histidinibacterium lentulum TaxID=2480588 RepID=A0A3N2R4Z4_9RHOB|nr:SRPBCC domain-containing protein [Histidinibacterium lentulum]ROU02463.1 hypothetical protein EAT49_08975 [Histidinibacterium lentulum]